MTKQRNRAVIYARISQDPLNKAEGVRRQVVEARALAESRGWTLVAEPFVDNDVSALRGAPRESYQAMMRLVEAGGTDRVITYHMSRLWRNRAERAKGLDTLRAAAVGLAAVKGPELDLTTATGRGMADVIGAFDTMESEIKAERVESAALQRAHEGRRNGTLPFGWTVVDGKDVEDPVEAPIVREVVDRLLAGDTLRGITADLNARGIPSPYGRAWGTTSVKKLAVREANAARRVYRGEVLDVDAAWPAIVDVDKHDRVRALMLDPARDLVRGASRRHLLTFGIGECGVCGGRLRASTVKRRRKVARERTPENPDGVVVDEHHLYVCDAKGCVGRNEARVDELVERVVVGWLERWDFAEFSRDDKGARELREKAAGVRARLVLVADDYADDRMTREQFLRLTDKHRVELDALDAEARRAAGPALEALEGLVGQPDMLKAWRATPLTRKRSVMAAMGLRVLVLPTRQGKGFDPESVRVERTVPA